MNDSMGFYWFSYREVITRVRVLNLHFDTRWLSHLIRGWLSKIVSNTNYSVRYSYNRSDKTRRDSGQLLHLWQPYFYSASPTLNAYLNLLLHNLLFDNVAFNVSHLLPLLLLYYNCILAGDTTLHTVYSQQRVFIQV